MYWQHLWEQLLLGLRLGLGLVEELVASISHYLPCLHARQEARLLLSLLLLYCFIYVLIAGSLLGENAPIRTINHDHIRNCFIRIEKKGNLLLAVILEHLSTCHTIAIRVLLLLKVRHADVLYRLIFDLNRHEGAWFDRELAAACRCKGWLLALFLEC